MTRIGQNREQRGISCTRELQLQRRGSSKLCPASIRDIRKFCLRQLVRETVYRAKYRQKRFRGLESAATATGSAVATIKVTDTVIQFVNELLVGKPTQVLPVRGSKQPTGGRYIALGNWNTTGSKNISYGISYERRR